MGPIRKKEIRIIGSNTHKKLMIRIIKSRGEKYTYDENGKILDK